MRVTIDRRFRGPRASGNGGYVCGLVAALVAQSDNLSLAVEVTLRLPPPLGKQLRVEREGERVALLDGDALVAEGRPAAVELELPEPVSFAEAEAARLPHGDPSSPFPECFVCGRDRVDGLRIFPGPLDGSGLVAAPWVPDETTIGPEFVWAALDCPGAYGSGAVGRGAVVLGRLAARVEALPEPGERCVVLGWGLGEEGRKCFAGTVLNGEGGRVLGYGRATWILPRP
ncbi:MAG TPA: hypothetical protein VFI37_11090 [Gaiellaceae bacterium]|nr:hypothetical protein [Gaiellaceae bacterium]